MKQVKGTCLCGETIMTVTELRNHITACHCKMCRKQNASAAFFTEEVAAENLTFNQEDTISVYPSSEWAERGFCNRCGTFLFYRYRKEKQAHLNVELFDDWLKEAHFREQIFYGNKPDYYEFANTTEKHF